MAGRVCGRSLLGQAGHAAGRVLAGLALDRALVTVGALPAADRVVGRRPDADELRLAQLRRAVLPLGRGVDADLLASEVRAASAVRAGVPVRAHRAARPALVVVVRAADAFLAGAAAAPGSPEGSPD